MRVRFLGFAHTDAYRGSRSGCEGSWQAREVREVPDETSDYLTSTFPGCFKKEGGRPRKVAVSAPPRDRAIKSPPDRALLVPDPSDILDGSLTSIRAAIASGAYDQALSMIRSAETSGKTRKSVLRALDKRLAAVGG